MKEILEHASSARDPLKGIKRLDCERIERIFGSTPLPLILSDILSLDAEKVKFKS